MTVNYSHYPLLTNDSLQNKVKTMSGKFDFVSNAGIQNPKKKSVYEKQMLRRENKRPHSPHAGAFSQLEKLKVDRKMSGTMANKPSCSEQLLYFCI